MISTRKQNNAWKSHFMETKMRYWGIGLLSGVGLFFLFGIVTGLIPNPLFARMVGETGLDYFFLAASSALLGSYIAVHVYKKDTSRTCSAAAYTGGAGSFMAFGCPVCNTLLVLLFGTTALLAYFEPYRPVLGFLSIGLLIGALYFKFKG